jgi:hypothetical protein
MNANRRVAWLVIYAVAMAYVESAVVVYLRAIYYPQGFAFPLVAIPPGMLAIEMGREIATLLMLFGVAMLAGGDRWDRLLAFFLSFGVWDLAYYGWLWVFLRWPPSLLTWDILFLIPVPWIGPVLAPVLVSVLLVTAALLLMRKRARGEPVFFPALLRIVALAGAALVLASFTLDFQSVLRQMEPPPFRWGLFGAGVALAVAALVPAVRRKASVSGR